MTYNLDRFKTAQEKTHSHALLEMKNGEKKGHWIWFTFPQITGLGKSQTSKLYEIVNLEEAFEYLKDEILSAHLFELIDTVLYDVEEKTALAIFGFTDSRKFHSSMTLFYAVISTYDYFKKFKKQFRCFENALIKYFNGTLDDRTLSILGLSNIEAPEIATNANWEIVPIKNPQPLRINLQFSKADFFDLRKGIIPRDMEERWFIYYENEWIYLHRSWTGYGFYKAKLNKTKDGYSIDEFWAERNDVEITPERDEYDRETFSSVIELIVLKRSINRY